MAVLWFVAEAEDVPVQLLKGLLSEEELMASTLYQSAFERGEAKNRADTIVRVLMLRLGSLDVSVRERIRSVEDVETLQVWQDEALATVDAGGAEWLVEKIRKAALS